MTGSLSESLQAASTEKNKWEAEHQGPLVEILGQVWWCGDDWCDCTRAQIVARFRNLTEPGWLVPRVLWQGEFHTDGETGARGELRAKRGELEAAEPELAAHITWQAGI